LTFPALEISHGGTFAFVITLYNQLQIYRVKPVYGRLFFTKDLGGYQLHEEYRYLLGRGEVYIYNQKGANPLSLAAIYDCENVLKEKSKQAFEIQDLAALVDKIGVVEAQKQLVDMIRERGNGEADQKLLEAINDGSLQFTAQKMTALKRNLDQRGLKTETIAWLNAYFSEDVVPRFYLNMRMITDEKFKLPISPVMHNFLPIQKTTGKKNIALIILNNSRIEVDANAKVEMDYDKGYYVLKTKDYGDFDIIEAKTRYKYGRQNIFIVMVETGIAKPVVEAAPKAEVKQIGN
jgi:hypothetical protein